MEKDLSRLQQQVKAQLRNQMDALRQALPHTARKARSETACQRLSALNSYQHANSIALYMAFNAELELGMLLETCLQGPQTLYLPRLDPSTHTISLHAVPSLQALIPSRFGILEPPATSPTIAPQALEVIVIPALAADPRGYRIGYGQGHYDRLLPQMPQALKICVLYDFQLIAEVPNEPHDQRVDVVVTDQRMVEPVTP